ncbi:hypothetical protein [Methanobrevibacter curvatus]|uniref:Uncharacterized protein n=1 Tax=Methanobrevibacter curvatus TaxID=49547 RepID=A0A165ZJF3_9EURY|nr:hypothetical protein [Methanobrevibacter curvatus]KZX10804.1 hypothetical protein MBCUR_16540 [Methanobrevibacter curvatus]
MIKEIIGFICAVFVFIFLIMVLGFVLVTFNLEDIGDNFIVRIIVMVLIFGISGFTYRTIANFNKEKNDADSSGHDIVSEDANDVHYDMIEKTVEKPKYPFDNEENLNSDYNYNDIVEKGEKYENTLDNDVKGKSGIGTGVKLAIGVVILVIVVFAGLVVVGMFADSDVDNPNVFNDSNISFKYPGNWVRANDSEIYLVLEGDGIALNMNTFNSEGYSLDYIIGEYMLDSKKDNVTLVSKNETIVDGIKAYDITFKLNQDKKHYSRTLIFQSNDKSYIFAFNCLNLDEINEPFNLVKNSIKINS